MQQNHFEIWCAILTHNNTQKVEIRLTLEDQEAEEFLRIKNRYGLRSYAETIRLLIKKESGVSA